MHATIGANGNIYLIGKYSFDWKKKIVQISRENRLDIFFKYTVLVPCMMENQSSTVFDFFLTNFNVIGLKN